MNIEELKQEERKLRSLLNENQAKQRELNTAAFVAKFGVNIGDTIEFLQYGKPKVGVVTGFDYTMQSPSYLIVTLVKSDGTVGKQTATVYGFPKSITKITKKS